MMRTKVNPIALATLALAGVMATAVNAAPPAMPATPAAADQVVYAQPFVLDQGFRFEWQQEKPTATAGYLLVVRVNPDLVYPRQSQEPVLYVGKQVAQRVNVGYTSGHVAVVVPAPLDENGQVALDLAATHIFFGTPELPERIDRTMVEQEHADAMAAGVTTVGAAQAAQAIARSAGQPTAFADDVALLRHVAGLVRTYSPTEKDLVEALLVPVNRPAK